MEEEQCYLNIFLPILDGIKIASFIAWEVENKSMQLENKILVHIHLSLLSLAQRWKKLVF